MTETQIIWLVIYLLGMFIIGMHMLVYLGEKDIKLEQGKRMLAKAIIWPIYYGIILIKLIFHVLKEAVT